MATSGQRKQFGFVEKGLIEAKNNEETTVILRGRVGKNSSSGYAKRRHCSDLRRVALCHMRDIGESAMAAGATVHLWELEDTVALSD